MKSARWLVPILLLAFALRLYNITTMSLRADEASNLFFASQDLKSVIQQLATDDPHAPLYFIILHFWVAIAGNSELPIRFLGVFAGTLTIALVHLLGKILLPDLPHVALLAAALAAINPSFIWDAQDAHLYPFLVLTSLASIVTFLQLSLRRRDAIEMPTALRWLAYVLLGASALYFHYIAAFILAAQGAIALFAWARGAITRRAFLLWLAAQFVIALLFLPWFLLAGGLLRGYETDFLPPANFLEMLVRSLEAFSVGRVDDRLMPPMVEPGVGLIAALFFGGIFLIGLWRLRDQRTTLGILLAFLFAPLACFAIFAILRFSIYDERYVLYLVPAFLHITVRGLIALCELPKPKIWVGAVMLIILVLSAHSLYNYWQVPAFAKSPDWRAFSQKIFSEAQPGDVLIQNYPDPALPYYLQNRMPRVLLPRSSAQNANDLGADLTRLAAKYDRLWFQPAPGSTWDTEGLVADWFAAHAREVAAYDFRGARLELYEPIK